MKKHLLIFLMFLSVGFISANAKASLTIATFADPSKNSSSPLFKVDFNSMKLTGGWSDDKNGLTLKIPYGGLTFANAWFDMNEVAITFKATLPGVGVFGQTGPGRVNFYQDGNSTNQLVVVDFNSGFVSAYSFGAKETLFTGENVRITCSQITGTLSQEQFSFGFVNLAHLSDSTSWNDGFTATAAFTSSAVPVSVPGPPIPEPATICLLGLGALSLLRRKRGV